jgi:hypothetical protein
VGVGVGGGVTGGVVRVKVAPWVVALVLLLSEVPANAELDLKLIAELPLASTLKLTAAIRWSPARVLLEVARAIVTEPLPPLEVAASSKEVPVKSVERY